MPALPCDFHPRQKTYPSKRSIRYGRPSKTAPPDLPKSYCLDPPLSMVLREQNPPGHPTLTLR
jgi:hypothetical protein